ncbi:MAG: SO_0444 family Cu/Zn efflux transporter [Bacteriovoracaceae bacterium]|nr:SO_0444 family Cu/Zn efflux transporter [Bacteriovoracaceae bacterium]
MIIWEWAQALWSYILLTAPYLLLGFLASGIIHQYLNLSVIKRHLAGKGLAPILKAALFGVPLPLCSCSVIPAAVTLKREGASNGATSSFLISTPESGIDSMVMTYGVMDLPMTLIRPIAAFLTATLAGIGQNLWNAEELVSVEPVSSCSKEHSHSHDEQPTNPIKNILSYAFGDLSDDLSSWLFIGLFVGALMNLYLPIDIFELIPGWGQRLMVLAFGIPFYICASASTPIAASMMMKGMSPGTALIFLLVGPATNFTNIAVLQKYIGKKGIFINVMAISLVAVGMSFLIDYMYVANEWSTLFKIEKLHDAHQSKLDILMGIALSFLILKGIYKEKIKPRLKGKKPSSCCE